LQCSLRNNQRASAQLVHVGAEAVVHCDVRIQLQGMMCHSCSVCCNVRIQLQGMMGLWKYGNMVWGL